MVQASFGTSLGMESLDNPQVPLQWSTNHMSTLSALTEYCRSVWLWCWLRFWLRKDDYSMEYSSMLTKVWTAFLGVDHRVRLAFWQRFWLCFNQIFCGSCRPKFSPLTRTLIVRRLLIFLSHLTRFVLEFKGLTLTIYGFTNWIMYLS